VGFSIQNYNNIANFANSETAVFGKFCNSPTLGNLALACTNCQFGKLKELSFLNLYIEASCKFWQPMMFANFGKLLAIADSGNLLAVASCGNFW